MLSLRGTLSNPRDVDTKSHTVRLGDEERAEGNYCPNQDSCQQICVAFPFFCSFSVFGRDKLSTRQN